MTPIITIVAVLQSFAISLGVGSSTLAILNFFAAIADGTIEPTERRMMGVVYAVLRVAMVLILLTTLFLLYIKYLTSGGEVSAFDYAQLTVLFVLFMNAALMTAHLMPSTFGPALQAGSWYTLGTLAALVPLQLAEFSYIEFLLGYFTWIVLAISVVNGTMAIQKARQRKDPA